MLSEARKIMVHVFLKACSFSRFSEKGLAAATLLDEILVLHILLRGSCLQRDRGSKTHQKQKT